MLTGIGTRRLFGLTPRNREHRPWGWFQLLHTDNHFHVKLLHVFPKQAISLQKHLHRTEQWSVISGAGIITLGGTQLTAMPPQVFVIPVGTVHQLDNTGVEPLEIIEVQTGEKIDENDIVRLADRYGRM